MAKKQKPVQKCPCPEIRDAVVALLNMSRLMLKEMALRYPRAAGEINPCIQAIEDEQKKFM